MVEKTTAAEDASYERIRATAEFAQLKRSYLRFVVPMTIAFMVWYLTYVICSNWANAFMDAKIFGNVNVALIFGLLQFVTTFLIAYVYSKYSAKHMDPIADKLRAEFDEEITR